MTTDDFEAADRLMAHDLEQSLGLSGVFYWFALLRHWLF